MEEYQLKDREKAILRFVIHQFILTANPVGSRNISKRYDIGLSPASIRNIMSDLEDFGYIDHPHTSAGRVPTDKGYRLYVDSLMSRQEIKSSDKGMINKGFELNIPETEELLNLTSSLLSRITKQLACVTYPKIDSGTLEKIQIVSLTSTRILVVVSITSGFAKTITLEFSSNIKDSQIISIQQLLNERLSGLPLSEIRTTFGERFKDVEDDDNHIIRLFIDSADKIFSDVRQTEKLVISGAKNILKQPEFDDPQKFQSMIELIEDKDIIIHILDKSSEVPADQVYIAIGKENQHREMTEYSFISKEYTIGDISGKLGIIGPKRMEYSKVIAIVDYMAKMLSEVLKNNSK